MRWKGIRRRRFVNIWQSCKASQQNLSNDKIAASILRKEVIQPQVPLRLPCYDFTPVMNHTVASVLRS